MLPTLSFMVMLITGSVRGKDCHVNPDSNSQWPEWPPILTNQVGDLILPEGGDNNRYLNIAKDQVVILSCPNGEFDHEISWGEGPLFATCNAKGEFDVTNNEGEEQNNMKYKDFGCREQPSEVTSVIGTCGPNDSGTEILIGFDSNPASPGIETSTVTVCHDLEQSNTFWSRHTLFHQVAARDHGNDSPPFSPDDFFDYDVQHFYTMDQQRETIAELVGSQELADQYVQDFNSRLFMARGHLAPNADFIFYSWMDATYHFINTAPQWMSFNGGNWMYLEDGLRDFAVERGLDLVVYTGTHGLCQLEDVNGDLVDIHLYNGNMLPVPRYYWKIVYDPLAGAGVAVIGVNNPHLSSFPPEYLICPPLTDHPLMENIYHPEDLFKGYTWACRVEDLASAVPECPHLPEMELLL